jgi:hypothetical protein
VNTGALSQTSANAYAVVTGSQIDTYAYGCSRVGFRIAETGGSNGITAKVRGSIDGSNWTDLTTLDAAGSEAAGVDQTIAASAVLLAFVTPEFDSGAKAGFRFYDVQIKSTVNGSHGTASVHGFAK